MKRKYLILVSLLAGAFQLSAQSPHFFGVTTNGGGDRAGSIYRTDTNGTNLSIVDTFNVQQNGASPYNQELLEVNGKMYGVTNKGGIEGKGVFFEFDPATGTYTVRHNFNDSTGKYPSCYLLLGSNGNIYGTATEGGANNTGTIFEYNTTSNLLTRKQSMGVSSVTGRSPNGKIVEASPGVFYGVCFQGGIHNSGTIFKYTLSTNIIENKDDFESAVSGRNNFGGLMQASSGILYGVNSYGGAGTTAGTLFQFDLAADSIKVLVNFNGLNGRRGQGVPIQIGGDLYGLTIYGNYTSSTGKGLLYKYNIANDTISRVRTFGAVGPGYYPTGELVQSTSGKYLVVMQTGGINNAYAGAISEWDLATNTFVNRASFNSVLNGSTPGGNLKKSSVNGKYYGLANRGGLGDFGTIYEFDPIADTIINKHNFSPSPNGKNSTGTLVKATNGKLYGITELGGDNGVGTIFEVDPVTNNMVKKVSFEENLGKYPVGGLTIATNGKLYGVTKNGGLNNAGVIFEYNVSTSTLVKLKDISPIGASPYGGLTQATNGKLYGTVTGGGSTGYGALYSYDITLDSLEKKDDFTNVNGSYPLAKLMQATNGKLYGTGSSGGTRGYGTLFEFDITADSIRVVDNFTDSNGARPYGGLTQIANGNIYGTTSEGGVVGGSGTNTGVVYQLDLTGDSIIPIVDFDLFYHGYGGYGELLEASNGMLYITSTTTSNSYYESKLIEFNPVTNAFNVKSTIPGRTYGSLIELVSPNNASIEEDEITQELSVYPNPTSSILNIDTKGARIVGLKIYSVSGQLIDSRLKGNNTIDVSQYKSGLYILQVETQNGIALSRFIKK